MNNLRTSPYVPATPPFFMVHLLHRLCGVDAPAAANSRTSLLLSIDRTRTPERYIDPAPHMVAV